MNARVILAGVTAVAVAAFVGWSASRTFYVGRMVLPRSQAVAIALTISVVVILACVWLWLAGWSILKWTGLWSVSSWVERPLLRYFAIGSLPVAVLLFGYGRWLEPRWVAVHELTLGKVPAPHRAASAASAASADDAAPIRIAVISDLHVDEAREPYLRLAEKVNGTRPDVILFLGDSLNTAGGLETLHKTLAAMHAPFGKLAVRGNWEAWYWRRLPVLAGTGFRWLDGEVASLTIRGRRVHLVGVGYGDDETGATANRLLSPLPASDWRVLMYHTPDLAYGVHGADLYVAGHTHGGQLSVPFFGALVTLSKYGKTFERGAQRVGDMVVYVTAGIGVEPAIPVRIGVRPEITLVELADK